MPSNHRFEQLACHECAAAPMKVSCQAALALVAMKECAQVTLETIPIPIEQAGNKEGFIESPTAGNSESAGQETKASEFLSGRIPHF